MTEITRLTAFTLADAHAYLRQHPEAASVNWPVPGGVKSLIRLPDGRTLVYTHE